MAASDKLRWRWQCHFVLGWRQRQRHACWLPRPPPGFGRCAVGGFEWRRAPKLRWTYRSPGQARAADHGSRNVEVKAEVLHVQVRRGLPRTRTALCGWTFCALARRKPVRACRVRTMGGWRWREGVACRRFAIKHLHLYLYDVCGLAQRKPVRACRVRTMGGWRWREGVACRRFAIKHLHQFCTV